MIKVKNKFNIGDIIYAADISDENKIDYSKSLIRKKSWYRKSF